MTFRQFLDKYHGKRNDYDGHFSTQCVDLFNFYNRDVVGAGWIGTPRTGGAQDLWESPSAERDKHYKKISKNAPVQQGDVLVWDGTMPGTGGYGHVAMAMDSKLNVIEQVPNSAAYTIKRDRNHLLGILRPKKFIKEDKMTLAEARAIAELDGRKISDKTLNSYIQKGKGLDLVKQLIKDSAKHGMRKKVSDLTKQRDQAKNQNKELSGEIAGLKAKIEQLQNRPPEVIEKPVDEKAVVEGWFKRLWNNLFKKEK